MNASFRRILPAAALALFLYIGQAEAVPALPGVPKPDRMTCRINEEGANELRKARALRSAPGYAAPISSTSYRVAVIRVDFSDQAMAKTFTQASTFFSTLQAFYLENSYNFLTVTATVSNVDSASPLAGSQGAYRMPRTYAYYAEGLSSEYAILARDAVAVATTAGFSFTNFDHIMIYHAGGGSESAANSTQQSANIWSAYAPASLLNGPAVGAKVFPGATFVPETEFQNVEPLGVICHEYGHQLGLPDLYSTANGQTSVGSWSLMDAGVYLPNPALPGQPIGTRPAHFDAWSKQFLGFSSPETLNITETTARILFPAETSRTSFFRLPINVSSVGGSNEYFLLEYRRTGGSDYTYDKSLAGQGLLIWHIDDSIASDAGRLANNTINTGSPNVGIDLVEADLASATAPELFAALAPALRASPTPTSNGGDAGDPWPGSSSKTTFRSPDSNAFNGQSSGIEVTGITGAGGASMSMTIKNPTNNPAITSNTQSGNVIVTGGANGYTNPAQNESALIAVRPTSNGAIEVKVYTLNGDLVWERTTNGSANQQTVISWDGKSTGGDNVASGIYLVHVNGGGVDMKKKIAIAR